MEHDQFKIVTRLSEERDMQQLVQLNNQVWNESNAPVLIQWKSTEEYAEHCPAGSQIVTECGAEICGYVSLKAPTKLGSNQHVVELVIAVSPEFQNKGIGRKLLDAAYDWGKKNGKKKLSLRVLSTNEAGINFYLKCGFLIQGRLLREFLINHAYVDDVLMYKLIE